MNLFLLDNLYSVSSRDLVCTLHSSSVVNYLVIAALNDLAAGVLHSQDLLTVEGDDENGALLHHLAHRQVKVVNVKHLEGV